MSYKILESNGVEIENIDGAQFNNFVSGNKNCIIKGVFNECAIFVSGNTLTLDKGLLLIQGVRIKITSPLYFTLTGIPSVLTNYHLVAILKLQEDRNLTVEIKPRIVAPLTQDDILKHEFGIYETEIATFNHNTNGNITDLTPKLQSLLINKYDNELSLKSENAVKNKVVAKELANLKQYANEIVGISVKYDLLTNDTTVAFDDKKFAKPSSVTANYVYTNYNNELVGERYTSSLEWQNPNDLSTETISHDMGTLTYSVNELGYSVITFDNFIFGELQFVNQVSIVVNEKVDKIILNELIDKKLDEVSGNSLRTETFYFDWNDLFQSYKDNLGIGSINNVNAIEVTVYLTTEEGEEISGSMTIPCIQSVDKNGNITFKNLKIIPDLTKPTKYFDVGNLYITNDGNKYSGDLSFPTYHDGETVKYADTALGYGTDVTIKLLTF